MVSEIYLGLDLGTSGCKLVAFDAYGNAISQASRSYSPDNPRPGWFELDGDHVWDCARQCFREVSARAIPGIVKTIGISSLGEAMIPVDRAGRVLAPAQLSADLRCTDESEELAALLGHDRIYEITGQPLSPIYSLPKLMWIKRHNPELIERTWKFMCFGDFGLFRLGLPPTIDESLAARTLCADVRRRQWSQELLSIAGVTVDQLSSLRRTGSVIGTINDLVADELLLPKGVVAVLGGHDQIMGALGAGVVEPSTAMYSLGTTEALVVSLREIHPGFGSRNIPCCPHAINGQYAALAGNQSGGRVLSWYRETFFSAEWNAGVEAPSFGEIVARLKDDEPQWPLLLPHFLGSGSVLNDHTSLATLFGLRFDTKAEEIMLSVLEGITLEQAISLEALTETAGQITELRAIGGGAQSSLWLQMKADILNLPIVAISVKDGPCLASAILGRASTAGNRSIKTLAREMVSQGKSFHPRTHRHQAHKERFDIYKSLYQATRSLSVKLRKQWAEVH